MIKKNTNFFSKEYVNETRYFLFFSTQGASPHSLLFYKTVTRLFISKHEKYSYKEENFKNTK